MLLYILSAVHVYKVMFSLVVFKNSPYSCFYYDKYMIGFQFFVINTSKEARIFVKANVVFIENNYHHNTLHIFLLFSSGTSVDYLFDKKSLVPPDFRICKYKLIIIVHLRCNVIVYILRLQDIIQHFLYYVTEIIFYV